MRFFPRLVLDYESGDLARLMLSKGDERSDLDAIDRHLSGGKPFALALSVRSAFDLLLSCLGVKDGDEIVLSGITIPGMAEIARHHGMKVRVADVDPDTLGVSPAELASLLSDRTRLFLYASLLGTYDDLGELTAICRERNVLFVEDAAQAWDGVYRGSPHADVVFFSFGPAKTATALGGAITIFRDQGLANRFRERECAYPPQETGWVLRRALKFAAFLPFRSPRTFGMAERLARLIGIDTDAATGGLVRGFPGKNLIAKIRHQMPGSIRHLLAHKLERHPGVAARKQRAEYLIRQLCASVRVPGRLARTNSFWLTAVIVDRPTNLVSRLRAAGFDATQGGSNLTAIADDETGQPPPAASAMMASIVYLPLSRYTRRRELDRIASIVNEHARANGG